MSALPQQKDQREFTYKELALLDPLVKQAKLRLRDEIHKRIGASVANGGDRQLWRDLTRSDRERLAALDALSARVSQTYREAGKARSAAKGTDG